MVFGYRQGLGTGSEFSEHLLTTMQPFHHDMGRKSPILQRLYLLTTVTQLATSEIRGPSLAEKTEEAPNHKGQLPHLTRLQP